MKLFFFLLLAYASILTISNSSHVVFAERMVRFTFNDGLPSIPLISQCSEDEFRYIDPLFNITTTRRIRQRRVLNVATPTAIHENEQGGRELATYPGKCKNACAGMAPGTCRASGCKGYRRTLQEDQGGSAMMSCDAQLKEIHDALDALILANDGTLLSTPCQRFIRKAARDSQCYDDVVYGEITAFTFVTATREVKVLRLPGTPQIVTKWKEDAPNGYTICSSIPFNIEIEANPCVKFVNVTLNGPNNFIYTRTDHNHPMPLFENTTTTSGTGLWRSSFPYGIRYMDPGSYNLVAIPDNFFYKEKSLEFHVDAC